jgi:hypothetical protein
VTAKTPTPDDPPLQPGAQPELADLAARVSELENKVGAMGRYVPQPPQNPRPVVDPKTGKVVASESELSGRAGVPDPRESTG